MGMHDETELCLMTAEFTALLIEFTATHHCSRNWLETVIEWIRISNRQGSAQKERLT